MTGPRPSRDELREHLRRTVNRSRDAADEMAAMFGGCDDPLHRFLTTSIEFRDWVDFVDRVARPLVEAEENIEAEQAAMALYRKASPFSICVSMVMMADRLAEACLRIHEQEDVLDAAGDLLTALPPAHLAPERDAVIARIDALSQATTRSPEPETPEPDRSQPG